MRTIDLTHTFDDDMPVYPGDPEPKLEQTEFIDKDGFNGFCLCSGMHVGTHMDAPLHMIKGADVISDIPPRRFFGRGRLVDARGADRITLGHLEGIDLAKGDIVVVLTGWYKRFREEKYYHAFPDVEGAFADALVKHEVSILALDTPSPDRPPFPIHKTLLGNGVLIIENVNNVEELLGLDFQIVALPGKVAWEAAQTRVVARVKES